MRPVRLTMQAFGPYPGRVAIDFRSAVDAGLFGIYGQTGSGKSTIFSAMTFALFGAPAKPDQEPTSLRSDHADPALMTEVEFVFDIGNRRYVIVRRPEQKRPKQRGNGETSTPHEAFLFEATGQTLESISENQRGKIIAEKKVGLVDQAVSDMLGYGADQFRQIVLLPQGRFETFLAAKTKQRLEILRDLFDVSLYRNLAAKLKADAKAVEDRVSHDRHVCAGRLAAEGFESTDALSDGIVSADAHHADLIEAEKTALGLFTETQTAVTNAEKIEALFKASETAANTITAFEENKNEMKALAERVTKAERARSLLDVEAHVTTFATDVATAEKKLQSAQLHVEQAVDAANKAAEQLKKEIDRADEIDVLRRNIEELERHALVLKKSADLKSEVDKAHAAERAASIDLDQAQRRLTDLQSAGQKKSEALKLAHQRDAQRSEGTIQLHTLSAALVEATAFEKAGDDVQKASVNVEQRNAAHETAKRQAEAAKSAYEVAEQSFSAAQALHLASRLEPGSPCPVCGSTNHPAPATHAVEHVETEQTFRDAKNAWQQTDAAARDAAEHLASARSVLQDRQNRLEDLQKPADSASSLNTKIQDIKRTLEHLGPQIDLSQANAEFEQLSNDIETLKQQIETLRDAHSECLRKKSEARVRLEETLSPIPESLRNPETLSSAKQAASEAYKSRLVAKETAERIAQESREAALTAQKDQQAADSALLDCRERHRNAITIFESRLAESGLTADDFLVLKPAIKTIETDRAIVADHDRKLALAKDTAASAAKAIDGKARPDLISLMARQKEAGEKLAEASDQRSHAKAKLTQLIKLRDELADTFRKLDEEEATSGPLRKLAALMNGNNKQNLDLETFAIGAMFDQVLEAANLRIGPMTNNRYRLERDLDIGRGRRGLDIQVFDTHTGKARSTSTLSGGETFIAALALALGLADVVESASCKIRLDTIFIDEGFGSLDTENGAGTLDQVLQVLSKLVSQNRSVGIISHVPLVQEAIPNGFYIRKDIAGSTVETKIAI
ncbi:AAA family ATPase [Hyphomicrobium methylovorum]|uniref:AAA family ATPase n=1 Tax=Hyphomicrobium methylovorum TaxID=84 RepID=UPI001AEEB751